MARKLKQFRQGDVFLIEVESGMTAASEDGKALEVDEKRGKYVLAFGEVTGHAHVVDVKEGGAEMFSHKDQRFLRMVEEGQLVHEEHGAITVPPGDYKVVQQIEYTEENEARQMAVLD